MSSGQEAFNIAFIRNGQPVQFKVQCLRQESTVRHDPEIEISIPFVQGRKLFIKPFNIRTGQRLLVPDLLHDGMYHFWLEAYP
jgi:hypothetical protein